MKTGIRVSVKYIFHTKVITALGLALISIILIVACKQPQPVPDKSFLAGVPCTAPCWQGITPGVTDEAHALEILSDPKLFSRDPLDCHDSPTNPSLSSCLFRRINGEGGQIGFKDGLVTGVGLNLRELTLNEVITSLDSPDFIGELNEFQDPEAGNCYFMYAYYLKGIRLLVRNCEPTGNSNNKMSDQVLTVFANMRIDNIFFFQPGNTLEIALSNLYGESDIQRYVANSLTWEGYGDYKLSSQN